MRKQQNREERRGLAFGQPSGYVIELGRRSYFWRYRKKRIQCASLPLSRKFRTAKAASRFVKKHFRYAGMESAVCEIRWALYSWQEDAEERRCFDGQKFVPEGAAALTFSNMEDAVHYQKEQGLQTETYIDICPVKMAA